MAKYLEFREQLNNQIINDKILENARNVLSNYFLSVAGELLINQEKHKDYGINNFFDALELLNEAFEKSSVILCNGNPNMDYLRSFRDTKKGEITSNHMEFLYYGISVFVDNFVGSMCSAEEYKAYHIVLNFCPKFAKAKENQISAPSIQERFMDLWYGEDNDKYITPTIQDDDLPF